MVGDDLEVRQPVKEAGKHHARHGGARLVWPTEGPPDFVLRPLLTQIVRKISPSGRMHPDRNIAPRGFHEQGPKLGVVQRSAGYIGENLNSSRSQFGQSTVQF